MFCTQTRIRRAWCLEFFDEENDPDEEFDHPDGFGCPDEDGDPDGLGEYIVARLVPYERTFGKVFNPFEGCLDELRD